MIRLVATDLDGTFWGADFVPPHSHVTAVRELMNSGVTVLAATSRRPRPVRKRLVDADLLIPAVLIDGSLGVDFRIDERFHQACFGAIAAGATLQTFRNHGLDPCIYVDHADYDIVMSETPSTCIAHQARVAAAASMGDLDATVARDPVYAFSVLGLSRDRLGPVLDELVTVTGAHAILFAEPDYGEFGLIVNPPGISKWTGIEAFCRLHDIDASEVMAVGDGLNDVPMLQRAAVAVAVRGGTPEATAVAHHLIDPPATAGWRQVVELVHQH